MEREHFMCCYCQSDHQCCICGSIGKLTTGPFWSDPDEEENYTINYSTGEQYHFSIDMVA